MTVGEPHASVAVAVPSAAFMSLADGLHPNVSVVPLGDNVGGVISYVHVTVLDEVDVLPQPSFAVKVLVWDFVHVPDAVPVFAITVGTP